MIKPEDIKKSMIEKNITQVDHQKCAICGYMTKYIREDDQLFFDPGCDCTGSVPIILISWEDISTWINVQNGQIKKKLLIEVGLSPNKIKITK